MKNKYLFVLCPIILLLFLAVFSYAQGDQTALIDRKITVQFDKQPLGVIFQRLMENFDLSIGFEQSVLDREHHDYSFSPNLPAIAQVPKTSEYSMSLSVERLFEAGDHPITVDVVNGTLSQVLDQIVDQMKNYKWEISDDVVNIFPVKGRDPRFKELLETNISQFRLPGKSRVKDITAQIQLSREFNSWLRKNDLHFIGSRSGADALIDAQYGRQVEPAMSFSKLTFRDLLNKISKVKKGGWILRWAGYHHGLEYVDLDI